MNWSVATDLNHNLLQTQSQEQLINNKASEICEMVKEFIDEVPISRKKRQECDEILQKIENATGIYKVVALRWLLHRNHEDNLKDLGDTLKEIKTELLNLGIDITVTSPLYT